MKMLLRIVFVCFPADFQDLHPYGPEGNLKVTASVVGYKPSFVKELDLINVSSLLCFQKLLPFFIYVLLKYILNFKSFFSNYIYLLQDKTFASISSSLKFVLVEEPEVEPKQVSVFNSPSNKVIYFLYLYMKNVFQCLMYI